MINKVKEVVQVNVIFILFLLAFSLTMMNVVTGLGITLLLFLVLLVAITPYLSKEGKTIDYWQFLMNQIGVYQQRIIEENERHAQWEKEQAEIRKRQKEQEEKDFLEAKRKEQQRRAEEIEKELVETHEMLKRQGISESAIAIALEEKRTSMLKEETQRPIFTEQQQATNSSQQYTRENSTSFELKKHGQTLNYIIFGLGFISLIITSSIIFSVLDFSPASGVVIVGLLILFLINYLFYLPTFLYHASTGGKFFIFILNMIFGGTVIGWIVLLIIVNSKNKEHAFREELMHHQRNR